MPAIGTAIGIGFRVAAGAGTGGPNDFQFVDLTPFRFVDNAQFTFVP